MTRSLLRPLAAVALASAPLAAQAPAPSAAQPAARPPLVVLVSVDQLRGDYHDRFAGDLTGGLARLYREGAAFTNAHHDHAITETAPGHATLGSGRFPRSHGITANALGVGDPQSPVIGGGGSGASPFRYRGSSIVDWMRAADPRSRALSISRKDRGAILPIGRAHQPAFWYATDGRFTTSDYYADTLPTWVQRFNARNSAAALAGTPWTLALPAERYAEADSVVQESGGRDFTFPHVIPADPTEAARTLAEYPAMDSLIADLALEGLQAMELGTGEAPDLLAVSFSTTDAVGHRYGPDSRELHDQIVRLDRTLARFLDSLVALRGPNVIVALSADHGVGALPGTRSRDGNAEATFVDLRPLYARTDTLLRARGVPAGAFRRVDDAVHLDRAALRAAGVSPDSLLDAFAADARRVPGVLRADRWDALAADSASSPIARRWLHMFAPDQVPDLVLTYTPHSVNAGASYFQHGAPHDYDSHVPLVFWGPAFRAGRHDGFVRTVDLAPTLAAAFGVAPTEPIDGRVLDAALARPAAGPRR